MRGPTPEKVEEYCLSNIEIWYSTWHGSQHFSDNSQVTINLEDSNIVPFLYFRLETEGLRSIHEFIAELRFEPGLAVGGYKRCGCAGC